MVTGCAAFTTDEWVSHGGPTGGGNPPYKSPERQRMGYDRPLIGALTRPSVIRFGLLGGMLRLAVGPPWGTHCHPLWIRHTQNGSPFFASYDIYGTWGVFMAQPELQLRKKGSLCLS